MRGHYLGRVIHEGSAIPNTGIPGLIGGFAGGLVCGKLYQKLPALLLRRVFGALLIFGGVRAVLG